LDIPFGVFTTYFFGVFFPISIGDNSEGERELRALQKENRQLKMENDILKQAALILGRKDV
jgi:cell division protein FtsB